MTDFHKTWFNFVRENDTKSTNTPLIVENTDIYGKIDEELLRELTDDEVEHIEDVLSSLDPDEMPFNNLFQGNMRLILPFNALNTDSDIGRFITFWDKLYQGEGPKGQELGWKWNPDFSTGKVSRDRPIYKTEREYNEASPVPGQGSPKRSLETMKIGKVLNKIAGLVPKYKEFVQRRNPVLGHPKGPLTAEEENQAQRLHNALYNIVGNTDALKYVLERPQVAQKFARFWELTGAQLFKGDANAGKNNNYSIIVTRSPIDVLRMADFDNIQSCHSPPSRGGQAEYYKCAVAEAQGHGAIAYIVKTEDLFNEYDGKSLEEIQNDEDFQTEEVFWDEKRDEGRIAPLSRVRLRQVRYWNKSEEPDLGEKTYDKALDRKKFYLKKDGTDRMGDILKFDRKWTAMEVALYLWKLTDDEMIDWHHTVKDFTDDDAEWLDVADAELIEKASLWLIKNPPAQEVGKPPGMSKWEWTQASTPGTDLAVPEARVYGQKFEDFRKTVVRWATENQQEQIKNAPREDGKVDLDRFVKYGGSYEDNQANNLVMDLFPPDTKTEGRMGQNTETEDELDLNLLAGMRDAWERDCEEFTDLYNHRMQACKVGFDIEEDYDGGIYIEVKGTMYITWEEGAWEKWPNARDVSYLLDEAREYGYMPWLNADYPSSFQKIGNDKFGFFFAIEPNEDTWEHGATAMDPTVYEEWCQAVDGIDDSYDRIKEIVGLIAKRNGWMKGGKFLQLAREVHDGQIMTSEWDVEADGDYDTTYELRAEARIDIPWDEIVFNFGENINRDQMLKILESRELRLAFRKDILSPLMEEVGTEYWLQIGGKGYATNVDEWEIEYRPYFLLTEDDPEEMVEVFTQLWENADTDDEDYLRDALILSIQQVMKENQIQENISRYSSKDDKFFVKRWKANFK